MKCGAKSPIISLASILYMISLGYGGIQKLRGMLYGKNILKSRRLPCKVVSIGNIAVGGTGKTPMTIYMANRIKEEEKEVLCHQLIISGGIQSFLDGYYLVKKSSLPAIYGQASGFLEHAREDYDSLRDYVDYQVSGYQLAETFLIPKFD